MTEGERRRFIERYASGMPSVMTREASSPMELWSGDDAEVLRRIRHDSNDPMRIAEYVAQIAVTLRRAKDDDISANQRAVEELKEILNRPPNGTTAKLAASVTELTKGTEATAKEVASLKSEVASLKSDHAIAKWLGRTAVAVALALGGIAVKQMLTGVHDGAVDGVRLDRAEQDIKQLVQDVRYMSRHDKNPQ